MTLGASGDLVGRLLLPGLGRLLRDGAGRLLSIVGSGMDDWIDERWRQRVRDAFATVDAVAGQAAGASALGALSAGRPHPDEDLRRLLAACQGQVTIFFALPPGVTARACQALTCIELPKGTRLALEKPFGTDAAGAEQSNELLLRVVPEEQIHRVDHFLGKSTVLNILGLRFANRVFEPVLNAVQLLSLLTMEALPTLNARELRDRKAHVPRATRL